jgi:single-strand DNA-binding protein
MSVNKVILIGNLGKNPEIRKTQSGSDVASFSIATSEQWKDKNTGEKKTKTEWHNIVVFQSGLISVIKNFVKKGTKVYLEGSLQTRKWTDKNNTERYSTEVILQGFNSNFTILGSQQGLTTQQSNDSINSEQQNQKNDAFDDLPF